MEKKISKKDEELKRRLKTALYFFSEKRDYEKSLSELKLAGNLVMKELSKKTKNEQKIEFEKYNTKLPFSN